MLELTAAEPGLLLRKDDRRDVECLQDRQQGDVGSGGRLHPAQSAVDALAQQPLGNGVECGVGGAEGSEQSARVDADDSGRLQGCGNVASGVELAP